MSATSLEVPQTLSPQTQRSGRIACTISLLLRLAFGALFLWTGIAKILDSSGFFRNVLDYHILPIQMAQLAAVLLPWTEFVLGVCLIAGTMRLGAWLATSLLLVVFIAAQISVLARGLHVDCGCHISSHPDPVSYWTVLRTSFMLCLAGIGLAREFFRPSERGSS